MRIVFLALLLLLGGIVAACEQLDSIQGTSQNSASATREPRATPEDPKAPQTSDHSQPTPRPADTPSPANTPLSVVTPLAVLPSYTPEPTATAVPRPTATPISSEGAKEQREEYIQRCKHWALRNMKSIEYSEFKLLDPYNMTDLDRVLWGSLIVGRDSVNLIEHYYSDSDHVEWCQDYWSEPLSVENMDKRNYEGLGVVCFLGLVEIGKDTEYNAKQAYEDYEEDGMSPVVVNQAVRLLNWMDIDGEDLIAAEEKPHDLVIRVWERSSDSSKGRYRESNRVGDWPRDSARSDEIEWWHIENIWSNDNLELCRTYYPQLFFGRWVPLDDFYLDDYGTEEWAEEAQKELEAAQDDDDWPEWADGNDRDILILLDK